jgi:hypothetical protein
MITAVLPATNEKPSWVEIRVDGQHTGRVWAHSVLVTVENALRQFHIQICGETGVTDAFLWADTIEKAKE